VNDSASHTASVTFSWVINAASSCSGKGNQLLGNPGFETGSASPWSSTAGVINPNGAGETAHSGSWYAWLDGYGTTHTDTLSQTVTIPTGCHATLSFWLHIDTAEVTTTTKFDNLTVTFGGTTVLTKSNLDAASGYTKYTIDVSSKAGTSPQLKFTGSEDASLQTSFVVDDTAVVLS
jgi:kumamolisin